MLFFRILIAATVAALISSTNVWADNFPREKFDLDEDMGPPRFRHPKGNGVSFATTGRVIDKASYLEAGEEVVLRRGVAQIYAGAWESREVLKDASRDYTRYGVTIHPLLTNVMMKEGMTLGYSDLQTALQVTEVLAESQDWQIAVLTARGDGFASATYYTTAFVYGIAVWGDRVIYKAWTSGNIYGSSWGVDPLTVDGEDTVLVLEKIPN